MANARAEPSMQHTHRLAYLAGHMFIDLPEGRFLVDTGSPASFGDTGAASYGGRSHPLPREHMGFGLAQLAGLGLEARIGARLRGLIGMDVLEGDTVLWDGPRGRAVVRPAAPPPAAIRIPFERVPGQGGVPIVSGTIGGRSMRIIIDTGAQYGYMPEASYVASAPASGLTVIPGGSPGDRVDAGEFTDHHPVLGAIRSASARLPVRFAAEGGAVLTVRERFGFHEPLSETVLRRLGCAGPPVAIVGCSWLPTRCVWMLRDESAFAVG